MEIAKKLLFILIFFQISSCSTFGGSKNTVFSKVSFESIKLGDEMSAVRQVLGVPNSKTERSEAEKNFEIWEYDNSDKYQSQRASISFDFGNRRVDSKTYVVRYGELESSLDFLFKGIFKDMSFEAYHLQRCFRDYTPATTFYINKNSGIIIVTDGKENFVDFYSWNKPEDATKIAEDIKACRR